MELRQLEYFVAVLDEGTFTKAAHRLHIAQSAVSHHLGKLERELGVELIQRRRPAVVPTPAGELFAARARRILAEATTAKDELSSLRGPTYGNVTFGATIPAASLDVPTLLATFRSSYPGVRVTLREGTGPELVDMVRQDVLDVAVASVEPEELPRGIAGSVVDMDHLVLAGPPGHPLERLDVVPVRELDRVELVSFRAGAGLRHAADVVLEEAGVTPQVVVESNEMPVLVGLVSHGVGLAIIPQAFVEQSVHQVWARPLAPPITPSLTLIWRDGRRRSPAAEAFLRHIALSTAPHEKDDTVEARP